MVERPELAAVFEMLMPEMLRYEDGSVQICIAEAENEELIRIRNHIATAVIHFVQEVVVVGNT